ncbi:MAG: FAD synthetase family protein [Clostridia bacterium]|nr:FAD synthetase family protein [Clostridia bacterium]
MSLIRLDENYCSPGPTALCLGTFDGVHLGHQALVRACCLEAEKRSVLPAAFVFERPPAAVIHPDSPASHILTTLEEKSSLLQSLGIRNVICAPFDENISSMAYDRFFYEILLGRLKAIHLVCGFHYRFGKNALGNAEMLKELCVANGLSISVIPPVKTEKGELVSSTAIRQYLELGNRDAAEEMLGRPLLHTEDRLLGGVSYGKFK